MTDWPSTLPQKPNFRGFSQTLRPNLIRSAMGYGPDKLRRRTTAEMYDVVAPIVVDADQLETLDTFYKANMALTWDWDDHTKATATTATYRFKAPPTAVPIGSGYFSVSLQLEMES